MPLLAPAFAWLWGGLVALFSSASGWLLTAFGWFVASAALPLAKKVLVGLGFGYVVFTGVDYGLQQAYSEIQYYVSTLPGYVVEVMAWFEVDRMITLILSAYSVAAAFKAATLSGIFHRG